LVSHPFDYEIRCEWGPAGLAASLAGSAVVVIVDVLSFCTAVDIAVSRHARVYPLSGYDGAQVYADKLGARLAGRNRGAGLSLSPASLTTLPPQSRIVIPSPNGAALSCVTGETPTLAGCLRNAAAVAAKAQQIGPPITVIPAGERWPDGSLRPALEDWLGAGAIIHHLRGRRAPEAAAAEAVFLAQRDKLSDNLHQSASGRELVERGFPADVALAAALNVSDAVPTLVEGAYEAWIARLG
jgi:2-phosphosulfolactate phosphatase